MSATNELVVVTNTNEFVDHFNNLRKANKGKWVFASVMANGKLVQYKAFDTWIQILRVEGSTVKHSSLMDQKVGEFLTYLQGVANSYVFAG